MNLVLKVYKSYIFIFNDGRNYFLSNFKCNTQIVRSYNLTANKRIFTANIEGQYEINKLRISEIREYRDREYGETTILNFKTEQKNET